MYRIFISVLLSTDLPTTQSRLLFIFFIIDKTNVLRDCICCVHSTTVTNLFTFASEFLA